MPKYRVLRGTYRCEDGTRAESGDIIEISEDRYDRLPSDSYERVEDDESAQEPEPEPDDEEQSNEQSESEPASEPDDTGITPEAVLPYDDYTLLSKMAALSDNDDVHGAMGADEITDHFEKQPGGHVADLLSQAESEMGDE